MTTRNEQHEKKLYLTVVNALDTFIIVTICRKSTTALINFSCLTVLDKPQLCTYKSQCLKMLSIAEH